MSFKAQPMKPTCPLGNKSHSTSKSIDFFNTVKINSLAKKCGFIKRNSGKIKPKILILSFMLMVSKKRNTYEAWSDEISLLTGKRISRQAVEERMVPETSLFLKKIFEESFKKKLCCRTPKAVAKKFKHIKLEDSTVINLPPDLSSTFPGNVSRGKKKSQLKIHVLYDFTKNVFEYMNIHSYTCNDSSLSKDSIAYLNKGDLLLRDMGFLVLDAIDKIQAKQAHFITLKKYQINVYDLETKEEIDLQQKLTSNTFIDQEVLVGKKHQKMRLVALPLPQNLAEQRRRKASKNRDRRLNHSKDYYQLLGYNIFLTNIAQVKCNAEQIAKLYGLRWQIEIIFKSWKTGFSLAKLFPTKCINPNRIYCMIYLWLIYILIFTVYWVNYKGNYLIKEANLSIIQLAKVFSNNFAQIINKKSRLKIMDLLLLKCSYDKRNDRFNLIQKLNMFAA